MIFLTQESLRDKQEIKKIQSQSRVSNKSKKGYSRM